MGRGFHTLWPLLFLQLTEFYPQLFCLSFCRPVARDSGRPYPHQMLLLGLTRTALIVLILTGIVGTVASLI